MAATTSVLTSAQRYADYPRDLRFKPCGHPTPRRLTQAQIDAFNRDGVIKPFQIFQGDEVTRLRRYFDGLLEQAKAKGRDSYSLNGVHRSCAGVWDIAAHPLIVEHIVDLLGDDVVCWGAHFFCKLPGDGKRVSWHQDAAYWPWAQARTITVWLAIDDVDPENGAMQVIPGSHHIGGMTTRLTEQDEGNVLWETVPEVEKYGQPIHLTLPAGWMSMHSDLLLHGSEPNQSTRRRCGLTLRYTSTDVRCVGNFGWHHAAILVHGQDRDHYWTNLPRPEGDVVQ